MLRFSLSPRKGDAGILITMKIISSLPELSVTHRYLSILLLCKLSVLKYKVHVMSLFPVMMNCGKDWHYRRI